MCKTMQVIVDREREDAEVAKGKRIALNLWKNGEHDLDKIAQTTELSLEQVREAITEPFSAYGAELTKNLSKYWIDSLKKCQHRRRKL